MKRILLIGATGQVGKSFLYESRNFDEVIAASRSSNSVNIELSNPDSIRSVIYDVKPNIVVNAAAYTAVDKAEEEPELATRINGVAPGVIAEVVKKINAKLIHYSTDYVFNGQKKQPYTEQDIPSPINVYGESKLTGDRAIAEVGCDHIIFRTSWVYSAYGNNFMKTILRLANEREEISVVDDQIGCPTSAHYIAKTTVRFLEDVIEDNAGEISQKSGIYNLSTSNPTSWYEFSKQIIEQGFSQKCCKKIVVIPIPSSEYPMAAERPRYTVLSCERLFNSSNLVSTKWKEDLNSTFEMLLNGS